ncbi:MAG: asparagine--tRNA ligase [Deltaproteobacteria bacterium RIFCSPHIGHO2_02_FULL_40_11]|nr:MAG: asparagine--tRNA ligase [Deltaproteobacteria bacterium RIFCSPHIGHO2_02_FULL_40_11]
MHIYIEDISNHIGKNVTLRGWVYNKRSSGKVKFLILRDGTDIIQGILEPGKTDAASFDVFNTLTQESSIQVQAEVREFRGKYELGIQNIQLVHQSKDYPITPKEHGVDFLMDHRHLWLRSSRQHAILRVRSELIQACNDYFMGKGFTLLDAPIFTPSACEGTTTLFEVKYFDDDKVYLTQSGQLYMEAGCMAFGKVYCFGPTFRAEKSKTRRHLTEFWMIEPEVAFNDLDDNMDLAEDFMEYIIGRVLKNKKKELEALERNTKILENTKKPFPRISYPEACEILKKEGVDFQSGSDFGGTDETVLAQKFDKPFFVHRFPSAIKAFYMKEDPKNPSLSLSVDMLAPEGYGEIIGGGQREERIEVLEQKIKEHNLNQKDFEWYFDLRRYGSVPHSGFGMGIERCLAWLCGLQHVRETIPFPRMLYRKTP